MSYYHSVCNKCGCSFVYDDEEIKRNLYHKYTECPVCGNEVKASDEPLDAEIKLKSNK